jgi:hypothetical protein
MKRVRMRLTYANVMSSIAVFFVVAGGTAFAASQLGKESVGTQQLKKEAVSLAKIKTSAKNSLKGAAGPAGPKGAEGPRGTTGPEGPKGATGPSTGPAGGDLTGSFPNPTIAADAVTGAKVLDRSLDAKDVTQASGQVTEDFGSLAAGVCDYVLVNSGLPDLTGYLVFASPGTISGWPTTVIVSANLSNVEGRFRLKACNVGTVAADPPSTVFNWAVMKVA